MVACPPETIGEWSVTLVEGGGGGGQLLEGSENDHLTSSHVLMITTTLNDSSGARVSDSELLSGDALEESLTAGGAIETDIANDGILFIPESQLFRG